MRTALLAVVALLAVGATPVAASPPSPVVNAAAWYVEGEDGARLAERNEHATRAIASITKLMTAIVVLEHAKLDDVVTVSTQAASIGESTVYLRAGEELTVADLLRALLIPSANDAAEALAIHVGRGSAERFVALMNAKAEELGLADTHFENPHGLDEIGHVSSALDATVLVRYALGIPFIAATLQRATVSLIGGGTFATTDDLLETWAPLVAGKTGHTLDAGWSEAAAARRGGVTVYGAVLGSPDRTMRNDALRELLTFGLDQYRRVRVLDGARVYAEAATGYGQARVDLVATHSAVASIRVGRPLLERVVAPTSLGLPVVRGRSVGRVEIYDGNRLVASSNLVAGEDVSDAGLLDKAEWYAGETAGNFWELVT